MGFAGLLSLKVEDEPPHQGEGGWKPLINVSLGSKAWDLSTLRKRTLDPTDWTLSYLRERISQFRKALRTMRPFMQYLLRRATVRHLSWNTTFGTGDAALTGFLAGFGWTIKSGLVSMLSTKTRGLRSKPHVRISPLYTETCLVTHFHCIFEFRVGHIIGAVASALWQSRQRRE
ncbi:MAG TPA: DUF2953 domain-containing protein [Bacillota bacterium]|nr:DUF2953 domain-containing protein [Bacillota bacterium]